eukprot:82226_1
MSALCSVLLTAFTCITTTSASIEWKQYQNYSTSLSEAYTIEYALTMSQCFDLCKQENSNYYWEHMSCIGVSWYEQAKVGLSNEPSRCYLFNTVSLFQEQTTQPFNVISSFVWKNMTENPAWFRCIDYPYNWADQWGDDCAQYASSNVCDNVLNDTSKAYLLTNTNTQNINPFESCCDCAGSLFKVDLSFKYSMQFEEYIFEPLWKSTDTANPRVLCQSNGTDFDHTVAKWSLSLFYGLCNFFVRETQQKYRIMDSLSAQATDLTDLLQFDCTDNNVFTDDTESFDTYICDAFDLNTFPYVIDLSNTIMYINRVFVDIDPTDFITNSKVSGYDQCNITDLIYNNTNTSVATTLVCENTLQPSPPPTREPNTRAPTHYYASEPFVCNQASQGNGYAGEWCFDVVLDRFSPNNNGVEVTGRWADCVDCWYDYDADPWDWARDREYIFAVNFIGGKGGCHNPKLGVYYITMERDFDVYKYGTTVKIGYCHGGGCSSSTKQSKYCPSGHALAHDIHEGEVYTVKLILDMDFPNTCVDIPIIHAWPRIECDSIIPTSEPTAEPTMQPTMDRLSFSDFAGYTCSDLSSPMDLLYNMSLNDCQSSCMALSTYPSKACVSIVWYEYINPSNPVPRCYIFDKQCDLVAESTFPTIVSFPYYDISSSIDCVNYPLSWMDQYHDDCDVYQSYSWCQSEFNGSTTPILSFTDDVYGLTAIDSCCDCNGGLHSYEDDKYLFEIVWKPTTDYRVELSTLMCENFKDPQWNSVYFPKMTHRIDTNSPNLNLAQFGGLCEYTQTIISEKYDRLSSIPSSTIASQNLNTLKGFDCIETLYFANQVTICNDTDYSNLFPFVIDIEQNHMYINNHYINANTFASGLPSSSTLTVTPYCDLSTLLNTTTKANIMTMVLCNLNADPTPQPTSYPTSSPSDNPSSNPTSFPSNNPSSNPSFSPSNLPSLSPTEYPSTTNPTTHPTTTKPTANPTPKPTPKPTTTLSPSSDSHTPIPVFAPTAIFPTIAFTPGMDPDQVVLYDVDGSGVSNYAQLTFPMSAVMEYVMDVETVFEDAISSTNSFVKTLDEVNIELSSVIPEEVQYGVDIASGALGIITGALQIYTGDLSGMATAVDSLFGVVGGILGIVDESQTVDVDEQILELSQKIYSMVQENNVLLQQINDLVSTLGDKIGYTSSYAQISDNLVNINLYWQCYVALIDTSQSVPSHCGCSAPFERESCKVSFADSLLDIKSIIVDHRIVYSSATGSSYWNNYIDTSDLSLLKTFAALTWNYGYSSTEYVERDYKKWINDYLSMAYQIDNNLRRSSRMRVWASSVKYGAASSFALSTWQECSRDILSLSSYINHFIPHWIASVSRPNLIQSEMHCNVGICNDIATVIQYPYLYEYIADNEAGDLFGAYYSIKNGAREYALYDDIEMDGDRDYLRVRFAMSANEEYYKRYSEDGYVMDHGLSVFTKQYDTMQQTQKYKLKTLDIDEYAMGVDVTRNHDEDTDSSEESEDGVTATSDRNIILFCLFCVLIMY